MIVYLDAIGAVFALAATYYLVKNHLLAWPIGLIAISISLYLYYSVGLYGDSVLALFYFISSLYGWYQWSAGSLHTNSREISSISLAHAIHLSLLAIFGIAIGYYLLHHFTDSNVAFIDATTTVLSIIAQWLMCRKIIQTWILWFIIDVINIVLYAYKGIPFHSVLMVIYLVMAVAGYYHWQQQQLSNGFAAQMLKR